MSNAHICGSAGRGPARKSLPELAEEAALLEHVARRQLLDLTDVIDGQLQQLVAIYERACGNVPRLRIEGEILKARSLIGELKALAGQGSR
jgi:hypothetical protein